MDFYILAGALASGKGTQARNLVETHKADLAHVSTGELFRDEIQKETQLGQEFKEKVDQGILISDEMTYELLEKELKDFESRGQKAVLLDGFPRNANQVSFLNAYIQNGNHELKKVIFLDLEKDVIKKRVLGRFECSTCHASYNRFFKMPKKEGICDICQGTVFSRRGADTEETLEKRLTLYRETILMALSVYEKEGLAVHINADNSPQAILEEIERKAFSH
ncbi:MAG: nucleoside monophosphate kinase [Alphaproteobacteria bacterium]|nr:nucleoside monophosphate kinase [Alphaproteobacteria bacterium]